MILSKIRLIQTLAFSSTFLLTFAEGSVIAGFMSNYYKAPPSQQIDQKRATGSGSRSNCSSLLTDNELVLLVPEAEVIHQTASSRPTFYFHLQTTLATPLFFNLISPQPYSPNPLWEQTLTVKRPGIYPIKLPSEIKLENGEIYWWQIGIPCAEERQQIAQVVKAAVKKVPLSSQTKAQLKGIDSPLEQSQIYAQEGIWYEALSLALQAQNQEADSADLNQYLRLLEEDANITIANESD